MNFIARTILMIGVLSFFIAFSRNLGIGMLLNPDALLIAFGGSVTALLIAFPFSRLQKACHHVNKKIIW